MKKTSLILKIVVSLIFLFIVGFGILYFTLSKPISKSSALVEFEVIRGDNTNTVLERLEAEKIISSAFMDKIVIKLNGIDVNLKAGVYEIDKSWTIEEILIYMSNGSNALTDSVKVLLKEGIWAKEIAESIAAVTNLDAEGLIAYWNDEEVLRSLIDRYDVLSEEILTDDAVIKLEGYLFPNTYDFLRETTYEEVTKILLNETERIYHIYESEFNESSYSVHELLTLASIVQFESGNTDEMPLIASVFYNRLNVGMYLQSSVTVCYSLYEYEDWMSCELNSDLDSPYNTYMYPGLPPGPILSMGEEAIKAVLDPAESDYYYFIGDVYGDGSTIFAKTLEEHNQNIETYLK